MASDFHDKVQKSRHIVVSFDGAKKESGLCAAAWILCLRDEYGSFEKVSYGGRVLRNASAMTSERDVLRLGIEYWTVLFPTEVSSFDFQVDSTDRTVQYKLDAQSLRLFGLHRDVNDAHRAGANRLQNKTKKLFNRNIKPIDTFTQPFVRTDTKQEMTFVKLALFTPNLPLEENVLFTPTRNRQRNSIAAQCHILPCHGDQKQTVTNEVLLAQDTIITIRLCRILRRQKHQTYRHFYTTILSHGHQTRDDIRQTGTIHSELAVRRKRIIHTDTQQTTQLNRSTMSHSPLSWRPKTNRHQRSVARTRHDNHHSSLQNPQTTRPN